MREEPMPESRDYQAAVTFQPVERGIRVNAHMAVRMDATAAASGVAFSAGTASTPSTQFGAARARAEKLRALRRGRTG